MTKPSTTKEYINAIAEIESNTTNTLRMVVNHFGAICPEQLIPELDQYTLARVLPHDFWREFNEMTYDYYLNIHYGFAKEYSAKITFWKIV